MKHGIATFLSLLAWTAPLMSQTTNAERPRARDAGVIIGVLPAGPLNAITDVPNVRVGQVTVSEGDAVRTGVTAILPHGANPFRERVPAAIHVGNGFGKLLGITQVHELGELETPILLTCTLCVWKAADAMTDWLLRLPGMEEVRSINPVVGETNDGTLNDIRARPIRAEHVERALESASAGPVDEGAVGAGTGTVAFGWKGGIGTSSRRLPASMGGHTVGVLVQSNFGGVLAINGAPVGRELGRYAFQRDLEPAARPDGGADGGAAGDRPDRDGADGGAAGVRPDRGGADGGHPTGRPEPGGTGPGNAAGEPGVRGPGSAAGGSGPGGTGPGLDAHGFSPDGSIMIVVATDAPLDARNLDRLAARALLGLGRTGATMSNGSGDYVIAFSTADGVRRRPGSAPRTVEELPNDAVTGLFQAVAEATEEAIINSLFRATTTRGHRGTVEALPIDRTLDVLRSYNALEWDRTLGRGGR